MITTPERGLTSTGVGQPTTFTTATPTTLAKQTQSSPQVKPPPGIQVRQQLRRLPKKVALMAPIVISA